MQSMNASAHPMTFFNPMTFFIGIIVCGLILWWYGALVWQRCSQTDAPPESLNIIFTMFQWVLLAILSDGGVVGGAIGETNEILG